MSATAASKLRAELTAAMVVDVLPGFAHSVSAEVAEFRQRLLDGLSFEGCRRVECVADVAAGAWLDALLPTAFLVMVMLLHLLLKMP